MGMSPHTLVGGMDLPASRQGAADQAWSRPARSKERRGADLGAYTDPPAAEAFGRLPRRPPVLHTDGWRHQSMSMSADLGEDRQASSVCPGRSRHPRGISRRL